jgi:hypothetical protein
MPFHRSQERFHDADIPFRRRTAATQEPPQWLSFLPLVGMAFIFWFLILRPQMRQQKAHKEKIAAMKKGTWSSPPGAGRQGHQAGRSLCRTGTWPQRARQGGAFDDR